MLQCRPPLDGLLNETLQGMERSLTSWGTVVPDKGWNIHLLHGTWQGAEPSVFMWCWVLVSLVPRPIFRYYNSGLKTRPGIDL